MTSYGDGSYIPRAPPSYSDSIGHQSQSHAGSHINSINNEDRRVMQMHEKACPPNFTLPSPYQTYTSGTYYPHPMYPYYGIGNFPYYDFNNWNKTPTNVSQQESTPISTTLSSCQYSNTTTSYPFNYLPRDNSSTQPIFNVSMCLQCTAELPRHHPSKCPTMEKGRRNLSWPSVCYNCRHLIPEHDPVNCPNTMFLHYPADMVTINAHVAGHHKRIQQLNQRMRSFKTAIDSTTVGTNFVPDRNKRTFKPKETSSQVNAVDTPSSYEAKFAVPVVTATLPATSQGDISIPDEHHKMKATLSPGVSSISNLLVPKKGHHENCNNITCFTEITPSEPDIHTMPSKIRNTTYTLPDPVPPSPKPKLDNRKRVRKTKRFTRNQVLRVIEIPPPLTPKDAIVDESGPNPSNGTSEPLHVTPLSKEGDSEMSFNLSATASIMSSDSEVGLFTSDEDEDSLSTPSFQTARSSVTREEAMSSDEKKNPDKSDDEKFMEVVAESMKYIGA